MFTGKLMAPAFNMAGYRNLLTREFSDHIAHAAFEWLNAVLDRVPTWSGASRATFLRLAQEVGYSVDISPVVSSRIGLGQRLGDGKITVDADKGKFLFEYTTTLPWLVYNEYNDANADPDPTLFHALLDPGPYHFQLLGKMAFERYAAGVQITSPRSFIVGKTYSIRSS
jgi:hypothetical protein